MSRGGSGHRCGLLLGNLPRYVRGYKGQAACGNQCRVAPRFRATDRYRFETLAELSGCPHFVYRPACFSDGFAYVATPIRGCGRTADIARPRFWHRVNSIDSLTKPHQPGPGKLVSMGLEKVCILGALPRGSPSCSPFLASSCSSYRQ